MQSIIETHEVATGRVREVLTVEGRIEAPNWAPSGDWLLVNGEGRLFRVPLEKPELQVIDTGAAVRGRATADVGRGALRRAGLQRGRGTDLLQLRPGRARSDLGDGRGWVGAAPVVRG